MASFTIFPAIDLRQGQVVRLQEGDPQRQTSYSADPTKIAGRWLAAGAGWLHVVNLDGAFDQPDSANRQALESIILLAKKKSARLQFGGGLRTVEAVEALLAHGLERAILGTMAIEKPENISKLIKQWGSERIAVSLDARDGLVQVHGWKNSSGVSALQVAQDLAGAGLQWLIYTDIRRDGLQQGLNLESTLQIAGQTGINVIASGGVASEEDILIARTAGLAGVIVGKALYEGKIDLAKLLAEQ
ncbi:MAG TPA: 1-(5-phosphoribosyl)-5-[(5-phosphoribosylamino)methylideneamino]imidazole-4-carboxamide isomerase [Anaerolineaceae bacterium]|jgi:phosphoribosylformimino-5-aminoimidazole carboxamide ribotide isomerase